VLQRLPQPLILSAKTLDLVCGFIRKRNIAVSERRKIA
jgi:hypothetical protein